MRYSKNLNELIKLRISQTDSEMIDRLCARSGLDRSKIIRLAIHQYFQNDKNLDFDSVKLKIISHLDDSRILRDEFYAQVEKFCRKPLRIDKGGAAFQDIHRFCDQFIKKGLTPTPRSIAQGWDHYYDHYYEVDEKYGFYSAFYPSFPKE